MEWGRGEVVWKVDGQPFIRFARQLGDELGLTALFRFP
jgi:hypothetical protein